MLRNTKREGEMAAIQVDAPAEAVFGAISDLTRHVEWATHDLKIEAVDDSEVAVGKTYTSLLAKASEPDQVTITELVPGQRFGWNSVMANGLAMSHVMTVSEDSGGSLVTRVSKVSAAPGLKALFRPLIAIVAPMDTKKNVKAMKSVLEQS